MKSLPEPEAAAIRKWAGHETYNPTMKTNEPQQFTFLQRYATPDILDVDARFACQRVHAASDEKVVEAYLMFLLKTEERT